MAEKKEQKPTIGRIVHFKTERDEILPAIVVEVHKDSSVNLQVFTNTTYAPPVMRLEKVKQGEKKQQWSWPPRDGE